MAFNGKNRLNFMNPPNFQGVVGLKKFNIVLVIFVYIWKSKHLFILAYTNHKYVFIYIYWLCTYIIATNKPQDGGEESDPRYG